MHDSTSSVLVPTGLQPDHAWWEYDELRRHCVELGAGERPLWQDQDDVRDAAPAGVDDAVRTDECLRAEIADWLLLHGGLDAATIEVHVSEGHVTLRGVVRDRFRSRAEVLVACVPGVICLRSQLASLES